MKKYLLVLACAMLLCAVGCGKKNQVVCTQSETENGITMKAEVTVDFDANDKLTDATAVYELSDKDTASQYCAFMKLAEDAEKGVKIECSGNKITIKGFAKMDEDEDEEKLIGMSKEDFINKMKEESPEVSCK